MGRQAASSKASSLDVPLSIRSELNEDVIRVRGARQHNLKNVDVTIPCNKMVVFTGGEWQRQELLAFDTILPGSASLRRKSVGLCAPVPGSSGQARCGCHRGFHLLFDRSEIDEPQRSTVGTVTEIQDYLRLLFGRAGEPHCPQCDRPI